MRGAAVAVLVVAVAAAASFALRERGDVGGRGGQPGERAEREPTPEQQLRTLVSRRARALASGDARALAALGTAQRRARDRREARRARRLGIHAMRAELRNLAVAGREAKADLALSYRVRGVAGRFTAERRMTAVNTSKGWRVRSVSGERQRPPWEVAAFRRVRSPHFVVFAPPGVDPSSGGLLAALEAGYERMRGIVVRGKLRRRYLVVVAGTAAQARRLTAGIRGLASLAALTDTEVRESGPARRVDEVVSQRLLVVWPAFREADGDQGATVVAHELTHAVLAPSTSGRTPGWLVEGVALYVSDDRRLEQAAQLLAEGTRLSLRRLAAPTAIGRLSGEDQAAAYAYSSAAAFYIAERFGRDALLELYDAFNDPELADDRAAIRRVLGVSRARLERDLRAWILS